MPPSCAKSASDSAAQQCDYATQQSDIDELMRSAPQDEAQPVLLTAAVAPMCTKLRQLLICRARVFDGSGCVDSGIGGTVKRLCEAITTRICCEGARMPRVDRRFRFSFD